MKNLFVLVLLLLPLRVFAFDLKVGDILLQPLACWSCSLIEAQEDTIYSHVGMVIQTEPEVVVIEAMGKVRAMPLAEFNFRTEKGQKLSVRRFQNTKAVKFLQDNKTKLQDLYLRDFDGLKYDHDFIWNNFDENGNEKLYCSEMITKLLAGFMGVELPVKRMKFDKNREMWIKYFKGTPPDGKWGNAPADFERSDLFYEVGEL